MLQQVRFALLNDDEIDVLSSEIGCCRCQFGSSASSKGVLVVCFCRWVADLLVRGPRLLRTTLRWRCKRKPMMKQVCCSSLELLNT